MNQALETLAADARVRNGLDIRLSLADEVDMPSAAKEALVSIVREALHNVVRHAAASRVDIVLVGSGGQTRFHGNVLTGKMLCMLKVQIANKPTPATFISRNDALGNMGARATQGVRTVAALYIRRRPSYLLRCLSPGSRAHNDRKVRGDRAVRDSSEGPSR